MKILLIILFLLFFSNVYCQQYVSPTHIFENNSFESITEDWPSYYPDWWSWAGGIIYYNIVLPGAMRIYFDRNVSYAMDIRYSAYDSVTAWAVFEQYIQFVKDSLGGSGTWRGKMPYYRYDFVNGHIQLDASRIYYTHAVWDAPYYLIYGVFPLKSEIQITWWQRPYSGKPKTRLQ